MTTPTLTEFYKKLQGHDWFYMMNDDPIYYRLGLQSWNEINRIAKTNGNKFQDLLTAYKQYVFSGKRWHSKKMPEPDIKDWL